MTSSLKDVQSADMVRNLAEMNYFKKECTVYGYSWMNEDNKRMYRLSDNEILIYRAFEADLTGRYSMTPVQKFSSREMLQDEVKEDTYMLQKIRLAKQIRENFNDTYFSCLKELQNIIPDEQAVALLEEWQEEIDGYFDEDDVRLFEGALEVAYATKHIPDWRYEKISLWLNQVKKQMSYKMQGHDIFERVFYGLAYKKDGDSNYKYIFNANESALFNQIKDLDGKGIWHTPVYHKKYRYNESSDLPKVRKQFQADLREIMNETYLKRMIQIQTLPSAIPRALWEKNLNEVKEECSDTAVEALHYWAHRWNLTL